jgi:hypothetical protein
MTRLGRYGTLAALTLLVACNAEPEGAPTLEADASAQEDAGSDATLDAATPEDARSSMDGALEASTVDAGEAADANPTDAQAGANQDAGATGADAGDGGGAPDASSDAAATPKEPFAVGSHWNESSKYAALRAAGVQMIRVDLIWDEVEPTQGSFDWPKLDAALAEAAKQNIKVLAVLGYTPSWARSGDTHNHAPLESFEDAWANYVQKTVSRYATQVAAWEIWNEPDHDNFLKLGAGTWAKNRYPNESAVQQKRLEYKHLLEIALAQPALAGKVLTTSGFAEGGNWDTGLRAWLASQNGFFERFDVASFHCYGYPSYQRLIDVPATYRALRASVGKPNWPLWITEHGINTTGVAAATVKTYLIRTYAVALAQPGVEKLFWFRAGYDPGHMDLFDASSKTTPAYDAFKTLTEQWTQPTQIVPWSSGMARGAIATLSAGKRVAIVWSEGGAVVLNTLGLKGASAVNQDGASVNLTSMLTAAPVFLTLAPI